MVIFGFAGNVDSIANNNLNTDSVSFKGITAEKLFFKVFIRVRVISAAVKRVCQVVGFAVHCLTVYRRIA